MRINPISAQNFNCNSRLAGMKTNTIQQKTNSTNPQGVYYVDLVNFTSGADTRTVPDIEYFDYMRMSDIQKRFFRKRCEQFNENMNMAELDNGKKNYLPLLDDKVMKDFLKVCDVYRNLKDEPILCLGRSPKWFLNTALWMKDGIEDYNFVAFSGYWYARYQHPGTDWFDYEPLNSVKPTAEEKKKYKKYLKSVKADPKSIVKIAEKTGKKVVITDYINSGKGAMSFLDVMSEFAEEDGILDEFANSIRFVGIGCMEYQKKFVRGADDYGVPTPSVPLPPRLEKYYRVIPQEFHDMPLKVFEEMLINENTNECRSTYFPHGSWTLYNPKNFRTGKMSSQKLIELRKKHPRGYATFNPTMKDYRNLLNFRILDYLAQHDMLRENMNSKMWS